MRFSSKTVLLIIDVQQGLDDPYYGTRCNLGAEKNMARLLEAWRRSSKPVIHIQHLSTNPSSPLKPGQPGCKMKDIVRPIPGERIFQKNVNSAFIGTGLEDHLRSHGFQELVFVGLTTDHCVSTSVRMANNLGFQCIVVADATAAFDCTDHSGRYFEGELVHAISLATLNQEFATIMETDEILQEFL